MKRLRIGHDWEIGFNEQRLIEFDGEEIIVRRTSDNDWIAHSRYCPHQNADLKDSQIFGNVLRCPWHGLQFDLASGQNLTNQCSPLSVFDVVIEKGEVYIYALHPPSRRQIYLGRYGWDLRVGTFTSDLDEQLSVNQDYVAQTNRGAERVTILALSKNSERSLVTGRILRNISGEQRFDASIVPKTLTYLESAIGRLETGIQLIHVEKLLDGNLVAYLLGEPTRALGPLAAIASRDLERQIWFEFVNLEA